VFTQVAVSEGGEGFCQLAKNSQERARTPPKGGGYAQKTYPRLGMGNKSRP